jgi:hypothetical protein
MNNDEIILSSKSSSSKSDQKKKRKIPQAQVLLQWLNHHLRFAGAKPVKNLGNDLKVKFCIET